MRCRSRTSTSRLPRRWRARRELLFQHLVREDRSALELLTADYTFVNDRLARHYGIRGVSGPDFRKVSYPDDTRRGLLGHGSVLTLTSHGNRTSPVLRGKWVMEVLLGSPPPPPPPDVPDLEETKNAKDGRLLSVAEQLAQHRASPACSSCHNVIDPIGLSLDNFDVTGAWRIKDRGVPVNVTSELYDGTPLNGVADLRAALLARSDVVVTHLTERLLSYALGRRVEHYDMPAVRKIVREAKAQRLSHVSPDSRRGEERCVPDGAGRNDGDRRKSVRSQQGFGTRIGEQTKKRATSMFVTQKHLSRRTVLRGVGATIALPFLDSMIPARSVLAKTAAARAASRARLVCIEQVHGAAGCSEYGSGPELSGVPRRPAANSTSAKAA